MVDIEQSEVAAMCQDANRIAAKLRGQKYAKPRADQPHEAPARGKAGRQAARAQA